MWPTFEQDPIYLSISEALPVGSLIKNLSATDGDSGDNGRIKYSLKDSNTKAFIINAETGVLSLNRQLDYEKRSQYVLVVEATDQAPKALRKTTSVTVKIDVEDANDNSPVFTSSSVLSVNDHAEVGVTIINIIAVDEDDGDNSRVSYSILSGNEDGVFNLDYHTGKSI